MKIIDNTPIENFDTDWGDPDGTGMKEKSKEQVQKFIKKKIKKIEEESVSLKNDNDSFKNSVNNQMSEQTEEINSFKRSVSDQIENYKPVEIHGDVTNAPDGEDLTTDENRLLKIANRSTLFGKGYKILRRNVDLVSQFNQENTIYEIRYDFDLGGETLNIPAGCTLKFEGGSFKNGEIKGTFIIEAASKVFNNVIVNLATSENNGFFWPVNRIYASEIKLSWWCDSNDDDEYVTQCVETIIDKMQASTVLLDLPYIRLTRPIRLYNGKNVKGLGNRDSTHYRNIATVIQPSSSYQALTDKNGEVIDSLLYFTSTYMSDIEGLYFIGNYRVACAIRGATTGILCGTIKNCIFKEFYFAGIAIHGSEFGTIKRNYMYNCGVGVWAVARALNISNPLDHSGATSNTCNLTWIESNYIIRCNYGIVFYSGSDIHISYNCISYSSTYSIYGMAGSNLCVIHENYFEGSGETRVWVAKGGLLGDLENTTTVDYLLQPHKGEHNEEVVGWGVRTGTSSDSPMIRPIIYIYNTNNSGNYKVSNNFISGGLDAKTYRHTVSAADFIDDQNATGVDCFLAHESVGTLDVSNVYQRNDKLAIKYLIANAFHAKVFNNLKKSNIYIKDLMNIYDGKEYMYNNMPGNCHYHIQMSKKGDNMTPGDMPNRFIATDFRKYLQNAVISNRNMRCVFNRSLYYFIKKNGEAWNSHFFITIVVNYKGSNQRYLTVSSSFLPAYHFCVFPGQNVLQLYVPKAVAESTAQITLIVAPYNSTDYENWEWSFPCLHTDGDYIEWEGSDKYDRFGNPLSGSLENRPTVNITPGMQYFENSKPIWWNGTNWVDSSGSAV